jgi:hypothetical protein
MHKDNPPKKKIDLHESDLNKERDDKGDVLDNKEETDRCFKGA